MSSSILSLSSQVSQRAIGGIDNFEKVGLESDIPGI